GDAVARRAHRFGGRVEGFDVGGGFDDRVPPAFGVVVAGGSGQFCERVDAVAGFGVQGEHGGGGQITEVHRHTVFGGVAQCLPLRGEFGERPERGAGGCVRHVGEHGDRRHQARIAEVGGE